MSIIPSNLSRVPNLLMSQIMLNTLNNAQRSLLETEVQLSTGRLINRASDDPLGGSTINVLDNVIERRDQWLRNLSHGEAVLGNLDTALADATDLMVEAKGIASSQIGIGSDAETRRSQAAVINGMLNEMFAIANRQYQEIFFFGGSATAVPPMEELLGGLRYQGQGDGLTNDVGQLISIGITISADKAFGALSSRVEGNIDLDPAMTVDTRLVDLNGGRGLGVSLGSINADVGGTDVTVDLSTAHTVQDVITTLETAIQTVDPGATVTLSAAGNAFDITAGVGFPVIISDLTGGSTAADLGLVGTYPAGATTTSSDVDPKVTEHTLLANLAGVAFPMGMIRIDNGNQTRDLDLSTATTVQELMNAVEGLKLGIRVEIAESGDRLNFINELSGGRMAIGEVAGGATATELGVRSLAAWTRLEDFNDGRGIQIRSGSVDPVTGLPDPAADLDFRITVKDGSSIDVDLAGAETVADVLDAINGAATVAGIPLLADLAVNGNGITINDATVGLGPTMVEALNGSFAAADLGILSSTAGASIVGEDRATVAVNSVFSHLMALRDALQLNDENGITLAAERFELDMNRLVEARAGVGVASRRVANAIVREEDLRIQDMALRSQVQDLDFTEAAIRFSTLQQQLQAGLLTMSRVGNLSLLDFLQ